MLVAYSWFFFFNDTATTEIYTLSLHDALPICDGGNRPDPGTSRAAIENNLYWRSEEHTSELQSRLHLVCRLLLEKKKKHHPPLSGSCTQQDARWREPLRDEHTNTCCWYYESTP